MKKILYSACMILAVCAAFVSCQKDVVTGHNPADNLYPQKDVVGVYEGQWCRTLDGVTDTIDGSLTLVAVDTAAFQVEVSVLCESISLVTFVRDKERIAFARSLNFTHELLTDCLF